MSGFRFNNVCLEKKGSLIEAAFFSLLGIYPGIRIRNSIPRVNCCKSEALQPYPLYP